MPSPVFSARKSRNADALTLVTMNELHHDEMGNHPLPDDPLEIQAALLANERCLGRFPYFAERYGERGKRFGASDSGYLITQCRLGRAALFDQMDWLARVLAARGMPRLLMEAHLGLLYDALVALKPGNEADYRELKAAGEWLRERRLAWVDEAAQEAICARFLESADPGLVARLPEAPRLVLSAHADQADGVENVVESLLNWLADAQRFPAGWVAAVQQCASSARQLVEGRHGA